MRTVFCRAPSFAPAMYSLSSRCHSSSENCTWFSACNCTRRFANSSASVRRVTYSYA